MVRPDLAATLHAAAGELAELSAAAERVGACRAVLPERWQSLDRISQHLAELGRFLAAVARVVPGVQPDLGPALAAIRVGALAARLSAEPPAEPPCELPGEAVDAGALELFDA